MKKFYVQLILLFSFTTAMHAQSKAGTYGLQVEAGYAFNLLDTYEFDIVGNSTADFNHQGWNIAVSPGYHVSDNLFAGVGVALYDFSYYQLIKSPNVADGFRSQVEITSSFMSVPLYAHALWKFRAEHKPSLFVSLKAGYGIILKNDYSKKGIISTKYSSGLFASPSIGYMYPINDIHALSLSVSYDMQKYTATIIADDGDYKNNRTNSNVAVKVGWAF